MERSIIGGVLSGGGGGGEGGAPARWSVCRGLGRHHLYMHSIVISLVQLGHSTVNNRKSAISTLNGFMENLVL